MRALVLGGGVVGLSTAYWLGRAGWHVTVLEAQAGLGLAATAGNAGILAPGHSFSWASPRVPAMLLRSLGGAETPIRVRLGGDPALYRWGARFLRECTAARAERNTLVKLRLCQYSQRLTHALADAEGLAYDAIRRGALYLYRDPGELEAGVRRMALLAAHGQRQEVLDAAGVARLDPVFEPVQGRLAGGVLDLEDSSGDARRFTEGLARVCRERFGLEVELDTHVTALSTLGGRVDAAVTTSGARRADLYVLALGVGSPGVARTAGVRLPIYPAKGYSATFPLARGGLAPAVPGVDEQWLVGWSRLGDRLRLTSTAEFAGWDWSWTPRDFNNIRRFAADVFPDAAVWDQGEYRACLRPMTPAGPPILGWTRYSNLLLNCGHGHMGWTMACGSGRIVADLAAGRVPEIDLAGLTLRP